MKLELLKDYKPFKKVIKAGRMLEVTNELGQKLIDKGIAKKYTGDSMKIKSIKPKESQEKVVILEDEINNNEVEKPHKNKK